MAGRLWRAVAQGATLVEVISDCLEGDVNCVLCQNPIRDYDPAFNRLQIDESRAVDICQECVDRFLKWQQGRYARLFPTNAAKKRFGKG